MSTPGLEQGYRCPSSRAYDSRTFGIPLGLIVNKDLGIQSADFVEPRSFSSRGILVTGVVAYPNPFSLASHTRLTFWGMYVQQAKIQIFTTAGNLARTLIETAGMSKLSWDGRNEEGDRVATGIYVYMVEDSRGKIALAR